MSKSTICDYKVDIFDNTGKSTLGLDKKHQNGDILRLNNESDVEKYALDYGKSLEAGGVNSHISENLGFIPYPNKVVVTHQKGRKAGEVIIWKAPMFMVW